MKDLRNPPRRKPVQARSIRKYNEILDVAVRLLERQEYAQVTMSEVHLESGYPYATIYQYFSGKEDIYLAWMERFLDDVIFELAERLHRSEGEHFNARIEMSVRYSLEQIIAHRQVLGKLLDGMGLVSSRMVEQLESKSRGWIVSAFGQQMEDPRNSEMLERMLTATRAVNGYWLMLMLNTRREVDIEVEVSKVASLIKALVV
ncbi:TetR/AcrR family transcriptional regulator [Ketobacter sp. MCCC 1A13808]|uniref:TetR/AcrR family transcriptional regulator n=1 Tax=Ketobacter sp. MCCC 1A13808 TaxID=2602738 RepID=UPI0012EB500D|nr:TetR/AcrR family transcriptional regulator [Ketobacter sp. MCCC 1A13808]MVF14881.1 TetR/AcrR family transcriptional regulator [Ketobacter sp. MCCC 1A13808]